MTNRELINKEIVKKYLDGMTINEIANSGKSKHKRIKAALAESQIEIRKPLSYRAKGRIQLDNDYFKNIDSPEKAYWLGFVYADGSVRSNKVVFSLRDSEPVYLFKDAIKSKHKLSTGERFDTRTGMRYRHYTIQVTSVQFAQNLLNMGISSKGSKNYDFPKINNNLIPHFLRGLFDGDGSISINNTGNGIRISLIASNKILSKIDEISAEIGLFKAPYKRSIISKNNKDIAKIGMYYDAEIFLKYLYKDSTKETRLERKYNLYLHYMENLRPQKRQSSPRY